MKKQLAPDSFSVAEKIKRLSLADKTAGAMKALFESAKMKKCDEVAKFANECGILSVPILSAVERLRKEKLRSEASADFAKLLHKIGLKNAEIPAEQIEDELAKLKLPQKKSEEFAKFIENFCSKYADSGFVEEKQDFIYVLLGALSSTDSSGTSSKLSSYAKIKFANIKGFDKKTAALVRDARTKTGKLIKVSPDGKEEGTVTPEKAVEIAKPGNT